MTGRRDRPDGPAPQPAAGVDDLGVPVRLARPDEIPFLQDVETRAGTRFAGIGMTAVADDPPPPAEFYRAAIGDGLAWVAPDPDDLPVGYLVGAIVDGGLHVHQVSVVPEAAGQGVGAALIDRAVAEARSRKLAALTLTTFCEVPWNAPYYARLGFTRLPGDGVGPGMAAILDGERRRWPDAWPRTAMVRPV